MRITNDLLKLYLRLKQEQKVIEMQLSEIKETIIENNGGNTADYIAVIKELQRNQVAGQKEFETKMGKDWLQNQCLIKVINYKQVEVLPKPHRTVELIDTYKMLQEKSISYKDRLKD